MWKWKRKKQLELHDLDFRSMAQARYGAGKEWKDLGIEEQVSLIREALVPRTFLIDPNSNYMKYWDMAVTFALVITAILTPFEISFLKPKLDGVYVFNHIVDVIFLKDMFMQFFIKVKVASKRGTAWVRSRKTIAQLYLKSWFLVDVLSIIPYDDISRILTMTGVGGDGMGNLKVIRLLRVLRLIKLSRILKASRLVKRWENRISLSSANQYMIKFTMLITVSCHWLACIWGLVGTTEGTALKCRADLEPDDARLQEFPKRRYFISFPDDADPYDIDAWAGNSWIVSFAAERAASSGADPCSPLTLYVAAMYWAIMTMTSIGYGDILPITIIEYITCIVCMMVSSIVWAYIIGCACSIMSNVNPERTEFERRMDAFNAMASDRNLPQQLRFRGREYIREERFHMHQIRNTEVSESLGNSLRGVIARSVASHYFENIWFFKRTSQQFKEDAALRFIPHFFERRELVDLNCHLCIVERGALGRQGLILVPFAYWGEDMLVCSDRLRQRVASIALTYSEICSLSREDLSDMLCIFTEERKHFQRVAVHVALLRAVSIYLKDKKRNTITQQHRWIHELFSQSQGHRNSSRRPSGELGNKACHLDDLVHASTLEAEEREHTFKARIGTRTLSVEDKLDAIMEQLATYPEAIEQRLVDLQAQVSRLEHHVFAADSSSNGTRLQQRPASLSM